MRGETVITYNDVTIRNCVTEQFFQEAVFDPTNTDLLYHRFVITVTGICHGDDRFFDNGGLAMDEHVGMDSFEGGGLGWSKNGQVAVASGTNGSNINPVKQLVWLRSHLEKPRKEFIMRSGVRSNSNGSLVNDGSASAGTYLLHAKPYAGPDTGGTLSEWKRTSPSTYTTAHRGDKSGYDLNNGPICRDVRLLHSISNTMFRVGVTFEVCKLECETGDGRSSTVEGVLSNRWRVEDSIDLNRMTVRTIRGRLRTTTPYINANHFRGWVVPALQDGFRRDAMTFLVTEDGLWLDYTITDKEIAYSAPQPATSWHMRHSEAIYNAREDMGSIAITLTGDRNTPKQELIRTAYAIYVAKLLAGVKRFRTEEMEIADEYGDNVNSVSLTARVSRPKDVLELPNAGLPQKPFNGLPSTNLGKPLTAADISAGATGQPLAANYERNKSKGAYDTDTVEMHGPISVVAAWNAYLQTSCDDGHEISKAKSSQSPKYVGTKRHDYTLYGFAVASLPTQSNASYLDNYENSFPYTKWQFESLFHQQGTKAQLPIAAQSSYFRSSPNAATSVVVMLGGVVCKRIIRFTGTRIGKEPRIPPAPETITAGPSGSAVNVAGKAELLSARIKPMTIERTTDGQPIYTVSGEYEYAIPGRLFDGFSGSLARLFIGVNPWEAAANQKQATSSTLLTGPTP